MTTLNQAIEQATEKLNSNSELTFVTIWKTGKSYGFNFENVSIGYSERDNGVTRKAVKRIEK
jgi:hypothetical protein